MTQLMRAERESEQGTREIEMEGWNIRMLRYEQLEGVYGECGLVRTINMFIYVHMQMS